MWHLRSNRASQITCTLMEWYCCLLQKFSVKYFIATWVQSEARTTFGKLLIAANCLLMVPCWRWGVRKLHVSVRHPDYAILYTVSDMTWLKEASPVGEEPTAMSCQHLWRQTLGDCIISLWWSIQRWLQFRTLHFQEEGHRESKKRKKINDS